jgi:NMD protein affecting ribosome stability and mRNA decay
MKTFEDLKWKEIQTNKVRVFQLEDELEIFYLIKIREDEYMIVFEDGYDQQTGKVEFANKQQVFGRYGVNVT